ncbi:hypothetical protein CNY89_27015, partial [Amaricoccus sp. HAR-UPW-R2A-40]
MTTAPPTARQRFNPRERAAALPSSYTTTWDTTGGERTELIVGMLRASKALVLLKRNVAAIRQYVPPPDLETLDCDYAASGILSIWSRRNWAGER